jgi:hypothetical protein
MKKDSDKATLAQYVDKKETIQLHKNLSVEAPKDKVVEAKPVKEISEKK